MASVAEVVVGSALHGTHGRAVVPRLPVVRSHGARLQGHAARGHVHNRATHATGHVAGHGAHGWAVRGPCNRAGYGAVCAIGSQGATLIKKKKKSWCVL